ncbi:Tyrosine-protein phosphatase YwqE [Chitinophaga costaii]|uniref:protein-tyrosine-phosphatase n=1 Tax=Chitinophaga costaii TaxID=1335309 RepID=A0A1C4CRS6_9BACT|nr:CpsB/CapC family capsule biosynthesis tyrosine phosphatase [Chitinophaga costaii]PUZ26981.1 hypothetical protein DCM91_07010 [Chitinophaga costaii]SCC21722.1 Tyrosine-protein phosphatase YwqE [Chitinophaga costaii]
MLFFNRPSPLVQTDGFLSSIGTDIHSHLLPAVDDGVQEAATAVHFIRQLQAWGIRQIITTPHIKAARFDNTPATLQPAYEILQQQLQADALHVPLRYAAEYYLDENFQQRLAQPLLTLKDNLLLVEISFLWPPTALHQWIFDLISAGYQPLLAHPERYGYMHEDFSQYENLKARGVQLQLNLLSLTGYYGKPVQKVARQLVDAKLIDYVGTDLHHNRHLEALDALGRNKKMVRLLEQYGFKNNAL